MKKSSIDQRLHFNGEDLTIEAVWRLRDGFFPPKKETLRG